MNHAIDPAVGCHYFLPGLHSFHQMALPVNGSTHLIPALLLIYRPRKDERLSWPSWLTCSGWFTHISGHPSAAGRAQDRESSPVRDRRSTTVLRHQPSNWCTLLQLAYSCLDLNVISQVSACAVNIEVTCGVLLCYYCLQFRESTGEERSKRIGKFPSSVRTKAR